MPNAPTTETKEHALEHSPGRLRFQRLIHDRAMNGLDASQNEDRWTRPRVWLAPDVQRPGEILLHLACNCAYRDCQTAPLPLSLDGQATLRCAGCHTTYTVKMQVKQSGHQGGNDVKHDPPRAINA